MCSQSSTTLSINKKKTQNIVFYSADLCFTIISLCVSPWLNPFLITYWSPLLTTSVWALRFQHASWKSFEEYRHFCMKPTLLQLVMRAGSLASITRKPASVRHWRWHIMLETCAAWIYSLGSKCLSITSSILLTILLTNIAHPQNYV